MEVSMVREALYGFITLYQVLLLVFIDMLRCVSNHTVRRS